MNILCVEQFSELGGGQRSLLDLLPAFSERGWRSCVVVPGEGLFPAAVRKSGYCTSYLNCSTYTSIRKPLPEIAKYACDLPRVVSAIDSLVDKHDIDLLYVNGPRFLPPAAWVARRRSVPLVFHCHSRLLQSSAISLVGASLRIAQARVIACCLHAAEPLKNYVKPLRLSIIYNGVGAVNRTCFRRHPLRRIGVVGRIEPEKGQMAFIQAARLVVQQFPDCRFSVIGAPMFSNAGYYREVVTASQGLPIEFTGWQEDISRVFSNLDLLVVPSTPVDATTRVILEAYTAGVPVVAFPSGGIPEILTDGESGFLAADGSPEALATRVIDVLRMDSSDLQAIVERAKKRWEGNYTLHAYRKRVCEVLARVVGPNTSTRRASSRPEAAA